MKRALACVLVLFFIPALATDFIGGGVSESGKSFRVLRLPTVPVGDECIMVAQPGSYSVAKGTFVQLEFTVLGLPRCGPYEVKFTLSGSHVVERAKSLGTWDISEGPTIYPTHAFFFKTMKKGHDTITMNIDGLNYVYEVEVN